MAEKREVPLPFADDNEETREVIKFISEEEAGVFDTIPMRVSAPEDLPAPQGYVPKGEVKPWTPGRKKARRRSKDAATYSPLRIAFISISIACLVGLGIALYSIAHIVQSGI